MWAEENQTNVTYTALAELARRHGLSADLAARLAGIEDLTNELSAPDLSAS